MHEKQNMTRNKWLIAGGIALCVIVAALFWRAPSTGDRANAQAQGGPRPVSVELVTVVRKRAPVQLDVLGTVTPIASVAIKSRIETTISEVHFADGANVKAGDPLFTLDARQIDAQIAQAKATLAKDRAQLAGAERDVARYTDLIRKGATTQVNLDNASTQADILRGTVRADEAAIENLTVQKSYTTITAPISGLISAANVKAGNFVRPGDTAPLATINQMAPVYVAFSVPQGVLPDLRAAMNAGTAFLTTPDPAAQRGKVTMIDNAVDVTTGMVTIRATMDNANQTLWPGTLGAATLTLREEESVLVPTVAVQRGQTGDYVFVAEGGKAKIQPVVVKRTLDDQSVIGSGLTGGEQVVLDGQLALSNGSPLAPRTKKAGS